MNRRMATSVLLWLVLVPRVMTPAAAPEHLGKTLPAAHGRTPASAGYWLTAGDGGVFSFGEAGFHGSTGDLRLNRPVVGMAATPSGRGYWLVASDGGVFSFGDARFHGSTGAMRLNRPIVGMAPTPRGHGYWLVASDGGVFSFGDARFHGSTGTMRLNRPIVGMAATPGGGGYWLVASDGGIFSFGDAGFHGSTGDVRLNAPVVAMATPPAGRGYWLAAADGGVFSFGDAPYLGSGHEGGGPRGVAGITGTGRGSGYWLVGDDGAVSAFGDAASHGGTAGVALTSKVVGMAARAVTVAPEVAVFYYPWYGAPSRDGFWRHWEGGGHQPPGDVASDFYPLRGPYSSRDPAVVAEHMAEIAAAGVDEVVTSWWGRGSFEDSSLGLVVRSASAHGLRVAAHLEPYEGRTAATVIGDIAYLRSSHGINSFYVYDSQRLSPAAWASVNHSLAGSRILATGNVRAANAERFTAFAAEGGFDGVYTYDPTRSGADFAAVCGAARQRQLLCAPSVAPQFTLSRLSPTAPLVGPQGGNRYDVHWTGALEAGADLVTVTSYNEWHEGTQIEPARPWCFPDGYCSAGYEGAYGRSGPAAAGAYLDRTRHWSEVFKAR